MDPGRKIIAPPALAERLLRACLPPGAAGLSMLGDLREEFRQRAMLGRAARAWFWREALLLSIRYTLRRPSARLDRKWGAGRSWNLVSDVRFALRSLKRSPATCSIMIVTLATAMGASAIGFSFADFALVRGLPVDDGRRVVAVYGVDARQSDGRARLSSANFRDLRDRVTTLQYMSGQQSGRATLIDRGIPTSLDVVRVTADVFDVMGLHPALGRLFQAGDDVTGHPAVIVVAHQYWERVLGADRGVVGRSMLIDGRDRVVVGVAPAELEFGSFALIDVWMPLEIGASASRTDRTLSVLGRLAPGVPLEAARAEVAAIARSLVVEFPEANREWQATVVPLVDVAFGRGYWIIMTLFLGSVFLVMVIASANAASLVLARALARRREIAVRAALGAGRARLLRQAVVEGLLISLLSAAVAVPLAELGLRTIRSFDAEPALQQLWLDWHEVGFIGVIALMTPVIFSLLPTLSAIRLDLRSALQSGGLRVGGGSARGRTVLVAVQLTLAVTLLTAAGLAVRTGINLAAIDPGIRQAGLLTFDLDLEEGGATAAGATMLVERTRERLARLPGVRSVHAFETLPVLGNERLVSIGIDGQSADAAGTDRPWAFLNGADAGALEAVGVKLIEGRWVSEQEDRRGDAVVLVGYTTAAKYFGSAPKAVGRRISVIDRDGATAFEIIGVVTDVLINDLERGPVPRVWTSRRDTRRATIALVSETPPRDLVTAVRREMAAVAPLTPLQALDPFATALTRFEASNQVVIGVFAGFAVLALLLAATGLYGLITYTVGQRLPEFATRFALGARPSDVLGLVLAQVARLVAIGLATGLACGLLVGQGMRSVLYGVSATDPITIASVAGGLGTVALLAAVRPAIRAARLNLVESLRAE